MKIWTPFLSENKESQRVYKYATNVPWNITKFKLHFKRMNIYFIHRIQFDFLRVYFNTFVLPYSLYFDDERIFQIKMFNENK